MADKKTKRLPLDRKNATTLARWQSVEVSPPSGLSDKAEEKIDRDLAGRQAHGQLGSYGEKYEDRHSAQPGENRGMMWMSDRKKAEIKKAKKK